VISRILLTALLLLCTLDGGFGHGDLHEVIDAVTAAIERSPDDPALYLRRAELHRFHKDWSAASADYARVRRLRPGLDLVTFGLAQIQLAQGNEKTGLKLLDEFLAKHPDHAPARALRAGLKEKHGDWKAADADLAAAVGASPEPHYATERANLLERHGQPGAAAQCLDAASLARGRVPILEQQALDIEERSGHIAAALRRLDDLIAREPRPDIWLARKAGLLERADRTAEAGDAWRKAAAAFENVPPDKRASEANRALAGKILAGLANQSPASR
jgi:predicted Zn-dependent protease